MKDENKKEEYKPPKVFISYSWTSEEHKKEVIDFASDLRGDGIDVVLDVWDAPDGGDLNIFMEENVTSPETDYVLLILDKEYTEKANKRKGGVGKETQIISQQVYEQVKETKFLPVIWETDEDNNPYMPIYLSSRKYFNLAENYYDEYDRLIRKLHNKPEYIKPDLGEIPKEILGNSPNYSKLKRYTTKFTNIISENKDIDIIITEFLNEYYEHLLKLKTEDKPTHNNLKDSTIIYNNIENYTPLRDVYIAFFEKIIKSKGKDQIDTDILIDFFTKLYSLTNYNHSISLNQFDYVTFDFILRESFIYLIMIGLKYRSYDIIADLFNLPYYFENGYNNQKSIQKFVELDNRGHINTDSFLTFYYHNVREKNRITGLGETLIERINNNFEKEELVDADLLCCYVSYLNIVNSDYAHDWFPYTYIYKQSNSFMFFRKLSSKRHFEKVKGIFNINTEEELKEKIITADKIFINHGYRFGNTLTYVKPIQGYIDIEKIGTER